MPYLCTLIENGKNALTGLKSVLNAKFRKKCDVKIAIAPMPVLSQK